MDNFELKNKIEEYETIIIHRHKRPDMDAIGSQMGLKYILKKMYPNKKILATGLLGYDEFNFIGKVDYVSDNMFNGALCIICDTANKARIEDDRFKLADFVIKLDHHQIVEEEQYGDLNIIYPELSSTCELIVMLSEELGLELDIYSSNYLFYGMYTDTGGFRFTTTTSETYRRAGILRSYPWDYEVVMSRLTTKPLHIQKLSAYSINNLTIRDRVGYIIFDEDFIMENNYSNGDISSVVNYLGEIRELDKWVVFNQYPTFVRVNIRSRSGFDISKVAVKYNGGGHKNASGASIKNLDDIQRLVDEIIAVKKDE